MNGGYGYIDVDIDVDRDSYFGCLKGVSKSVQVLLDCIETVVVLNLRLVNIALTLQVQK